MSEDLFWNIGAKIIGHNPMKKTRFGLRRFRGEFGVSPNVCSFLWERMSASGVQPHSGSPNNYFLCALLFLKVYPSENVSKSIVGIDEKTWRQWTKVYIHLLAYELDVVKIQLQFV